MSCSFRTNESKTLNWYDFVMQYVIITFRQVIFSDTSTSGLNLNWQFVHHYMLSWQFLVLFFKVLLRKVLARCKLVLWYRFRQNENVTAVWDFFFAPSWIYLSKFCTVFQQKALHQIKFILWFFGLETCKQDSYLQKANLFIQKIP